MTQHEGTRLGPYRLLRLIGRGGAGEVYRAEQSANGQTSRVVAVKVLRGGPRDATAIDIVRQVRAAAAARQPHMLPVYDAAESDDALFIAMAFASGGSLGTAIKTSGQGPVKLPLGPGVVARLVSQVARTLGAMHQSGMVHGDLKPHNLFVRTAPNGGPMVAIADFGQAAIVRSVASAAAPSELTWASETLRYAAPEQVVGEATTASDQYGLAVIAYLLITGRYPIGDGEHPTVEAVLHTSPTPPSHVDPTIDPAVDSALLRALSKTPGARFPDVATFAQALDDGLAMSSVARAGVTQEFRALAGSSRATMPPPPNMPGAPHGDESAQMRPASNSLAPKGANGSTARPLAPPPRRGRFSTLSPRQRVFAGLAGIVMLAVIFGGALGIRAILTSPGTRGSLPNFGGLDYAPTVTPNAVQQQQFQAVAQTAERDLAAATSGQPGFSDALASNTNHWPIDGTQSFFGSDKRLHLSNHDLQSVYSVNQPIAAPVDFVVSVKMTFLRGNVSDPAGLRIRVAPPGSGTSAHDMIMIAPDGRYECWRFDGSRWQILDFGYTPTIKRGLNQTNTLTVLARGSTIELFVNSAYVTTVEDRLLPKVSGMSMGPAVIYAGTEVAYTNYLVYALPN